MQSRLLAVPAPGGEKARQLERCARRCRLQPLCRRAQGNGVDFALDAAWAARFKLLRLVPDQAFHYRHTGGREAQRLALDQDAG